MSPAPASSTSSNVDPSELARFSTLASQWWDPHGKFRPLHDINPLRLELIETTLGGPGSLKGKRAADIGCGGGLVSEGMAARGAQVVGIDLAGKALTIARLHALESGLTVDYREMSAEELAAAEPASFDLVTCLEMLEHVPDPAAVVAACARLAKPGAPIFFSTISRTPKAYALAIVGAEYVLGLLPKGTHDYEKFIRPSELEAMASQSGLRIESLKGLRYNPFTHQANWCADVSVNYLMLCRAPS